MYIEIAEELTADRGSVCNLLEELIDEKHCVL